MFKKLLIKSTLLVMLLVAVVGTSAATELAADQGLMAGEFVETVYAEDDDDSAPNNQDDAEDDLKQSARDLDNKSKVEDVSENVLNTLSSVLSLLLLFLSYLLWPILVLIGLFMDTTLIFGGGMEERLLSIWSQIRNLVNLGFVLGIVAVALYNVIGIDSDGNYAIKKVLPKIVIGLIIVNFSFIGVKLVIDGANVVTTAMFALPNAVESDITSTDLDLFGREICGTVENLSKGISRFGDGDVNAANVDQTVNLCADDSELTGAAKSFFQSFSHNNMALVMAVQFGQIPSFMDVSDLVRKNPTFINLAINLIFSVVMFVVYVGAYLSLLAVLVARMVVLWLVVALSPLLAVKLVLPDGLDVGLGNLQEEFTKHLIAPIKIGFGMSVGFIMLGAMQQVGPTSLNFSLGEQFIAPFSGLSTVQDLIIAIGAVAIVWKVTFDAAQDTLARDVTNSISSFLGNQGRWFASLPLYLPLPFVPTAQGQPGTVMQAVNRYANFQREVTQQGSQVDANLANQPSASQLSSRIRNGRGNAADAVSLVQHYVHNTNNFRNDNLATLQDLREAVGRAGTGVRNGGAIITAIDNLAAQHGGGDASTITFRDLSSRNAHYNANGGHLRLLNQELDNARLPNPAQANGGN